MNTSFTASELDALDRLRALLASCSPLALAFSGGLDSRFLAHAAGLWPSEGIHAYLVHITGPHVPEAETRAAALWAGARGLPLTLIHVDPLSNPEVLANGETRCYHCKLQLFSSLLEHIRHVPPLQGATLCDGTNADDLTMYRPGLRALRELGIRSPLAEAGLNKDMLRHLGAQTGLEDPLQAARPCLLTRFAYGVPATAAVLPLLARAEEAVGGLLALWAAKGRGHETPEFRLRLVGRAGAEAGKDVPPAHEDAPGASGDVLGESENAPGASEDVPGAYRAELHVAAKLGEEQVEQLAASVAAAGFPNTLVRCMEAVRGYYDRDFTKP